MMFSKRSLEGYLLVDNSQNEGVPDSLIQSARAAGKDVIQTGRGVWESPTVTCSHCHTVVVLNPDRTRPRNYCGKCDHYICDNPGCNIDCVPMNKVIDDLQEQALQLIGKE